jgi:hypothetical protein
MPHLGGVCNKGRKPHQDASHAHAMLETNARMGGTPGSGRW